MTGPLRARRRLSTGSTLPRILNSAQLHSVDRGSSLTFLGTPVLLAIAIVLFFTASAGEVDAQPADDHGDTFRTATQISFGTPIIGRIDHGDDRDVFALDLSRASGFTNVWIFTTGELNTRGWLYDAASRLRGFSDDVARGRNDNLHLRDVLPRGTYYISVRSHDGATGAYTLHAQLATDPGSSVNSATPITPDTPTPGTITAASDGDYFRLEFTHSTNVGFVARSGNFRPIDVTVTDEMGTEIPLNVRQLATRVSSLVVWDGFWVSEDFGPGTYYVKVATPRGYTGHPVPYTALYFVDETYTRFIEDCAARTNSLMTR